MAKRREREREQRWRDRGMDDPRVEAGITMLRRTGAQSVGFRYQDDHEPTLWLAEAMWLRGPDGVPVAKGGEEAHECAGALDPLAALMRLLDQVMDGGKCAHCGRPTGVEQDFAADPLLPDHICWYQYDPELKTFRRSCEGETEVTDAG